MKHLLKIKKAPTLRPRLLFTETSSLIHKMVEAARIALASKIIEK